MKSMYINILKSSFNLGELKNGFKELFKNKYVVNFILSELNCRRDAILFDDKMSSEQKEGALIQLRELVEFFNGGVAYIIQDLLNKEHNNLEKKESEKLKLNKLKESIKLKVLK